MGTRRALLLFPLLLQLAHRAQAETTYTRDAEGRIASVTTPAGTTSYLFYPDGEVKEVLYPDGTGDTFDHEEIIAARALVNRLAAEDREATASAVDPLDASANRFSFTGHYFDRETGLYYAGARYYDPTLGRFTTADTLLGRIEDPPSLHRFAYARSSPTRYVDPTGHDAFQIDMLQSGLLNPRRQEEVKNAEARAAGSLWGGLRWARREAWGVLNLALGRGWQGFGERAVEAAEQRQVVLIGFVVLRRLASHESVALEPACDAQFGVVHDATHPLRKRRAQRCRARR
jgi:RHS repeat-associated protein